MSITWIRHGEKLYKNGNAPEGCYGYDPPLKSSVYSEFGNLCSVIKNRYGIPKKIITSPFLRTRQTAFSIANQFLIEENIKIPISVDTDITEFLGWRTPTGGKADVDSTTKFFIEPVLGVEKIRDVKQRVEKHLANISNETEDVLVVTHGIIIQFIHRHLMNKKIAYVKELSGINISNNKVTRFKYKENK